MVIKKRLVSVLLLVSSTLLSVDGFDDFGLKHIPEQLLQGKPVGDIMQGECFPMSLKFCQAQFAEQLRSNVKIFEIPSLFVALLSGIYMSDIHFGFLNMCNARNEYVKCLGDSYAVCTDFFELVRNQGYNTSDAFLLAGVYDNIDFDCSSGFTQAIAHWGCIVYVHSSNTYKKASKTCYNAYNQTVTQDPQSSCAAAQTYSMCLAKIYEDPAVNKCDYAELMWWECEKNLRSSKLDGFCNTNTCNALFDNQVKSKYESVVEQANDGGLLHPALRRMFKMAGMYGRHHD